jgi:nucleotide-binding universal stress UspA family protein
MPYKVIIVGTDGSERASIALHKALELAKATGGTLHVAHGVDGAVGGGFADTVGAQVQVDQLTADTERIKSEVHGIAKSHGVEIEYHNPSAEHAADALIALAKEVDADIIVIGNRGKTGVNRILGSVPHKVSHHSPCSVLIVNTDPG